MGRDHLTVLVTGAAGFLGHAIVARLQHLPQYHLIATTRQDCELSVAEDVAALWARHGPFDAVLHTAAHLTKEISQDAVTQCLRDTVLSQVHLTNHAARHGPCRLVLCSSLSVEREPHLPYSWSKHAAEHLLEVQCYAHLGLTGVSLRFAGLYGPTRPTGLVAQLRQAVRRGEPWTLPSREVQARLVHVEDAADAAVRALTMPLPAPYACYPIRCERGMFTQVTGWSPRTLVDYLTNLS